MTLHLPSRYHIGRELGRGGMGIVYEADDERLGRKVAVKVLHVGPESGERKLRFAQEARAASALNHPNIITIYDIDAEADVDFIVMELVDGMPLTRAARDGPMPIDRAIDCAIQIASALAASHAANIVHRDLKPANIMVTDAGRIKVLDFGLSKWTAVAAPEAMTAAAAPVTRAGIVVGTSGYMSPEQALGQPVDARSDVFSFGVVLYEVLAGRRAFTGDSDWSTINAVVHEQPTPLSEVRPEVPETIRRIVTRCLEKDRTRRYPSAVELLDDLRRLAPSGAPPPRRTATSRVLAGATAILLAAALAASWIAVRQSRTAAMVEESLPEIERLVAMGQYFDAYRIAQRAARAAPGDPRVRRALFAMTAPFAMDEPTGADVYFKDYLDVDGPWQLVGRVPIKNARIPLAELRWKIVKDGFDPGEGSSPVGPLFMIQRIGAAPPGMVHVRGGRLQAGSATLVLPDFWIDKFEVTNREFKRFVDAGGYRDPKYWMESFAADDAGRRFEETVARFTDKTGRLGPATWELGVFPEGQADFPVGGVSWYEAAAYAVFVGKRLPTVFHWRQATGNVLFGQVVAAMGNFNGRSAEPQARLKDLGAYGTYGLAGNVREWIWNAVDDRRSLVGGAWSDPPYMAGNREPRSPLDRAESDGFRCVRDIGSVPAEALAPVPTYIGAARTDKPVSDSVYETYKPLYTYDRRPLDPRVESTNDADRWRTERITIPAAYGRDRVPINIYLPKNTAPPYQAVVWFPGGYALGPVPSSRDLDDMPGASHFNFLPRSGRALIFPIYQGTFERFGGVGEVPRADQMNAYREMVTQWSKDLGRTIDYLETRPDIDASKLGYYSLSMGSNGALPIVAMETRLKAAVLVSGGLPAIRRPPEADPINFAGHITVPTLMVSGRNDFIFPLESTARPLFVLLGAPADRKRLVIHDGGHVPQLNDLIRDVLGWFDQYLGSVRVK